MDEQITITKFHLQVAFRDWVTLVRSGKMMNMAEAEGMSDSELVIANTDHLWSLLISQGVGR